MGTVWNQRTRNEAFRIDPEEIRVAGGELTNETPLAIPNFETELHHPIGAELIDISEKQT
jgi:hypothetical protein